METRGWMAPPVKPGIYSPIGRGRRLVKLADGGRYEAGPWAFSGVMPHYWMPHRYPNFGSNEDISIADLIVAAFARSRKDGFAEATKAGKPWINASRQYVGFRAYTEPELTAVIDKAKSKGANAIADLLTVRRVIVRNALKESATPPLAVGDVADYALHNVPRWLSTWGFGLTIVGIVVQAYGNTQRR